MCWRKSVGVTLVRDLRGLSKTLDPARVVQLRFDENVQQELEIFKRGSACSSNLRINGGVYKFLPELQTFLLGILQEALKNIRRHSGATEVEVNLDYDPQLFTLEVIDNGKGFNPTRPRNLKKGSGLNNMKKRTHLIGGNFEVGSCINGGTRIQISLPLPLRSAPV